MLPHKYKLDVRKYKQICPNGPFNLCQFLTTFAILKTLRGSAKLFFCRKELHIERTGLTK